MGTTLQSLPLDPFALGKVFFMQKVHLSDCKYAEIATDYLWVGEEGEWGKIIESRIRTHDIEFHLSTDKGKGHHIIRIPYGKPLTIMRDQ